MPKYRNDKTYPVAFGGVSWLPGQETETKFFVPSDLGLTKTSDLPAVASPILLSQSVVLVAETPQTVEIPWGADRISVSAVAGSGEEATLKLGDSTIGIPLNDTTGGYLSPNGGHKWSKVAKLTLESTAEATVTLLVEGEA